MLGWAMLTIPFNDDHSIYIYLYIYISIYIYLSICVCVCVKCSLRTQTNQIIINQQG
jgi:hypothetical protein